ncbi:MAG: 4Fe-4S dicluster domain-containing protein [Planctomycetota bacterium]
MAAMKTYRFRFDGAPRGPVEKLPVPDRVTFSLMHSCGELMLPKVEEGVSVKTGTAIAWSETEPNLAVLSSVTGKVTVVEATKGKRRRLRPGRITIERAGDDEFEKIEDATRSLEEISPQVGRSMLIRAGMWPLVGHWPRDHRCLADPGSDPHAVVVKGVKAQPFGPRGHILLAGRLDDLVKGLGYLQRVVGGSARIHLILTAEQSTLAQDIKERTSGKAWIKLHFLPVAYPVENDGFLHRLLFADEEEDAASAAWYVDLETVMSLPRCLGNGIAPYDRVIALGGNGYKDPVHVQARLGTSVNDIVGDRLVETETRLVRGGFLTGRAIEDGAATIDICDEAISAIVEGRERRLLGFLRPGLDTDSYSSGFLSLFRPDAPRDCSTNLRGEPRRCVCCGYCEEICPAGIMPHQLYKYSTQDMVDEIESTGIHLCVECGLCSYVCPSKIEIMKHLLDAKARLAAEKAEAAR